MKKYILYALLILVSSSCTKEFTELSPISERNIKSAYKTEADFAVAVNGLYDALQLNGTNSLKGTQGGISYIKI